MSTKTISLAVAASTMISAAAFSADRIDMDEQRRALGREDNVRIDAQLLRDTVSPGSPIGVTYQIENLTASSVAIAHKISDASYDQDSRTITLAIGSEVPLDGNMPHMVVIAPGEKKVFRTAALPSFTASAMQGARGAYPRYVQVKVTILRDLAPFSALLETQERSRAVQRLSDELFDRWLESSDTILLNSLPVMWSSRDAAAMVDASQRGSTPTRSRRP
jgi:hypothetical protein